MKKHKLTVSEVNKLVKVCKQFITEQKISCAETIYTCDRVIDSAYEFIEKVCDVIGYHVPPEEE